MRISPITMTYNRQNLKSQNQNKQNQNVNFGKFEDKKADELAYKLLEVDSGDSWCKSTSEYFRDTLFVTIKVAKDTQGKDFVYAVMNKEVTDKHENKHRFDEVASYYAKDKNDRFNQPAKEVGIIDKEPNYLTLIEDFTDAHNLYEELWKAEEDYTPPPSGPKEPEPQETKWWEDDYERFRTLGI